MADLTILRKQLDNIDKGIMDLITKRFETTRQIGVYKKENNMPPADLSREAEIYEKLERKAEEYGVEPSVFVDIWKTILTQVKKEHEKI